MKKESLSIMIIKTLLGVIIFTGMGIIIVGGVYIIGEYYKTSNDQSPKNNKTWNFTHKCSEEHPEFCDRSCQVDSDCKSVCGCGCLNLEEKCQSNSNCLITIPCECENGKCEKVKEEKEDNQNDYFINKDLGIKFDYSSIGLKEKLIVKNNQIIYHYPNSNNIEYISLFTKKANQTIEDAILDIIKNEGKDPKNCKVVNEEKYFRNPDYQAYRLDLANSTIIYSEQELERIKIANIEAEQDGGPFNGEHQKQVIRNERLIKACSYYADPLGLGTSSTIPSRFIYNNKNKFVFLPGLADPSFYQEDSIELFDDYYQDEEEMNTSNWQTYRNEEFGFEIDYKSFNSKICGKPSVDDNKPMFCLVNENNKIVPYSDFRISILQNSEEFSAKEFAENKKKIALSLDHPWHSGVNMTERETKINGYDAYLYDNVFGGDCGMKIYYIVYKDKAIKISFTGSTSESNYDNMEYNLKIFNQMLSTFRFIEK